MQNPEEIKAQLPAPQEFEDLVINPILPKKKKALKVQKPRELTAKLSAFLGEQHEVISYISMGVSEKNISEPSTEQRIRKIINSLNLLYDFLVQYKRSLNLENGMLLVFENNASAKLAHLLNDTQEKFNILCSYKYQLNSELINPLLKLYLFLHNHTCFISKEEIDHYNTIEFVIDLYLCLATMSIRLEQFAHAEYYLRKEKELIDVFKVDKISTVWLFLANNYSSMATVYSRKSDYVNAKEYTLKANSFFAKMAEKGIIFDINAYKTHMEFMQLAYKFSRFDEALFWAKIALSHCKDVIVFTQMTKESVNGTAIKDFESKIKSIKALIQVYKNKLFQQKHEELKLILNGYPLNLNNNQSSADNKLLLNSKLSQVVTLTAHENNEIAYLLHLLRKLYIVCQYDAKNNLITIFNLNEIHIKSVKSALEDWKSFLTSKQLKPVNKENAVDSISADLVPPYQNVSDASVDQAKNEIDKESSLAIKSSAANTDSTLTELDTEKAAVIKRKNLPSIYSEASPSDSKTKKLNRVTSWGYNYPSYFRGSHTVFKLRGDLKRHYLTIKPELLGEISQKNPMAAKNLLNICDRGKQLGDSKGDKEILVTGDKAKAKDSSKPYRFFGRVVATKTDEKGKVRTLIEFNGWTENHKQKVPNEITPPTSGKNVKPRSQ